MIPVVFSHCSSSVFCLPQLSLLWPKEQFAGAATDAAAPFDCKSTSYTSRSPLGMAASTYGRLHELHGFQHLHQFGALFLHELQRVVLVTRAGSEGSFSQRLSLFDGYLLGLLWRLHFQRRWPGARFWIGVDPPHHGRVAVTFPRMRCLPSSTVIRWLTSTSGLQHSPLPLLSSMRKWRTFFTDADPTSH